MESDPSHVAALLYTARTRERVWREDAFAELFRQHYVRLVGLVVRLVGERAQAEEIAGDAFWKLYHQPQLQADGNNVPGWLYRTATRMGIDALRGRKRRQLGHERLATAPAPAAVLPNAPLDAMLRAESVECVRAVLRRLRPAQAQILVLRHSGLSYQEIAAALDMKFTSVGTTLARAEAAFEKEYCRREV